jgi:hypothetical protein
MGLVLRRPGTILLIAMLSSAPMTYWSALLFGDTRADVKELLPNNARSVLTLAELERRFGGRSYMSVVVESPSREANRKVSDLLVERIRALPEMRSVRNQLGEEKKFFEARKWLYIDLEDLRVVQERIEDAINDAKKRANPLIVDLEDKGPVELDLSDIEKKYASRTGLMAQFPTGYFERPDGTLNVILISRKGNAFGIAGNKKLVAAVGAMIAEIDPAKHHPEMRVGLAGDIANLVVEQEALIEDLMLASLITLALLAVLVIGYYRRWRAVILLFVPVFVGTTFTFGISHFIVGHLNASSAFLGPIIPGNGINFGLVLLARYIEERRGGRDLEPALRISVRSTAQGTSTAAMAASIAYGSLIATDFLGFKHFGIVGGLGMILCWIGTFAVMPPLIVALERVLPATAGKELALYPPGLLASIPARIIGLRPRLFSFAGILVGLAGVAAGAVYLQDPFEKDFQKLRSTVTVESGPGYWQKKVQALFGRSVTPQVLIVDRIEDVAPALEHLEGIIRTKGDGSPIADVTALQKLVPKQQSEKLEVLAEIRSLLDDDLLANLSDEQRAKALDLRPPEALAAFGIEDLPSQIRADFRELDGREGLVLLVNPNIEQNQYDADVIRTVGMTLRKIPLPDGRFVESSGTYVIYTDMLDAVARDGPKATLFSLAGVIVLCFLVYRRLTRAAVVVGSLLAGVGGLAILCLWLDLRINFLNFIAIPITFGIGVDYSVNTYSRYLLEKEHRTPAMAAFHAIASTGGAVVLCSLTTVVGYGSLLVARNGGLVSFGKVAIFGELTTLLAAIVFMPAWLMAWGRSEPPP